jgi:hypothetical protein
MKVSLKFLPILLVIARTALAVAQSAPPWSKGANDPAARKGYVFRVSDVDNVPDLHGNPSDAKLVIFIGGNQFFVLPQLITAFEHHHPELKGHIFYETLPPGVLRKQIAADDALTLGNLTIQVRPDVYEAGARELREMERHGQVKGVAYGTAIWFLRPIFQLPPFWAVRAASVRWVAVRKSDVGSALPRNGGPDRKATSAC